MRQTVFITLLGVALLAAGGAALVAVFGSRRSGEPTRSPHPLDELRVAWRVGVGKGAGRPCAVADDWVVADAAGGVTRVSKDGRVLWRTAFSNESFVGACVVSGGRLAVASDSGRAYALDGATGAEVWRRQTDARFQHAPLTGLRGAESVLWLVSQEDGRLFCLRAADGTVLWTTEPTNRCDGEPTSWPGRLAYGNCDGAIYVFDASDGKQVGKIEVGEEDQMAGGILALRDGRLAAGTRSGRLVVVNPATLDCAAAVKVSEGEAFVTPVELPGARVAMGVEEGHVTIWRHVNQALVKETQITLEAAVTSLASAGANLYALAGGTLVALGKGSGFSRLSLGDEVGALAANGAGDVACVADGALVCVKGGGR